MKTRIGLAAVLLVSAVLLSWADAFADGFMVSRVPSYILDAMHGHNNGADITGYNFNPDSNINPIVALSVKYHTVKVTVDNGVATTYVDEVFLNDFNVDIEGMYYFPLPEEATVKSFSIYVNGKKIEGKVMDKDQARAAYEGMVRDMREPALLEYVGRNLFKVSVYPIPAKGEKRVELIYQQVLKYDNGIYTYDYPLDTERFSPKPLENVLITANIKSNIPIKSVYSATHN
ncbi:MAG: VIT domain-containing protein, partial [Candidatus Omnitrophica bacterium]|nr:VIT domain-containing protein [Candidatus Omnitrophota bacterium]